VEHQEEETRRMKKKGLEGSQTTPGKEDGTRDPDLSQRPITTRGRPSRW